MSHPFAGAPVLANAAHPFRMVAGVAPVVIGVGLAIGMPPPTMSLPSVMGSKTNPPEYIVAHRDRFEMIRVYTSPIAAQMVDGEFIGNRTNQRLVGNAVG